MPEEAGVQSEWPGGQGQDGVGGADNWDCIMTVVELGEIYVWDLR